ncbi:hypothetical protein [Salinigranum marinum]|uniref:hypothetical protein n=1 Tax=Salinigranum marinum TaxID=1515595 RepID=UPI002989A95C|nr:hypothetical protein [Salinigranum marinum]
MHSRRRLLIALAAPAGTTLVGCLSGATDSTGTGDSDTATPDCTATPPPKPTDAATSARAYPDRPTELTSESIEGFLSAYERAYQYNDALAASPNKIGRTNEFTVFVQSVSVDAENEGFTATVSGQYESDFLDTSASTVTPETATETPLPAGRGPFEASYVITDRLLRREGVVHECW